MRAEKALQGLLDKSGAVSDTRDPEELQLLRQIGEEKKRYKDNFEKLRMLKQDIQNIHVLLERRFVLFLPFELQGWVLSESISEFFES